MESPLVLWSRYKGGDVEAREELVKLYLPFVKHVLSRMVVGLPPGVDRDDLLSFALMGLLEAMERFDPGRGVKFESFAASRIRGAVIDELRRADWLPRSARAKVSRFEEALRRMVQERGGVAPSEEEVMEELKLSREELEELFELSHRSAVLSLDHVLELEDEEVEVGSILPDPGEGVEEEIEREERAREVAEALGRLPERERLVLTLYYYEGLNLREIASVLGVTESRVSQIHGKAISSLRALLCGGDGVGGKAL